MHGVFFCFVFFLSSKHCAWFHKIHSQGFCCPVCLTRNRVGSYGLLILFSACWEALGTYKHTFMFTYTNRHIYQYQYLHFFLLLLMMILVFTPPSPVKIGLLKLQTIQKNLWSANNQNNFQTWGEDVGLLSASRLSSAGTGRWFWSPAHASRVWVSVGVETEQQTHKHTHTPLKVLLE